MAGPTFDPKGALRFDLARGAASDPSGGRLVVLPGSALAALERVHPEALEALGAELGRALGARAASRLGGAEAVRRATLEAVASHLAGELALGGVGALHVERWGRALVLVIENPVVPSEAFLASVLGGALGVATGREVACAALDAKPGAKGERRFFVGSTKTVERALALVAGGASYADVLGNLQGGAS